MTTDDMPGTDSASTDPSSAHGTGTPEYEWLSIPADWFELEPEARRVRADFAEICCRASVGEIVATLEAIWSMLDRASLWVSSLHIDLTANSTNIVDRTYAALLPTISRQMRSLTYLGRNNLDHLPTAMAAARATFEVGLRLAWINAPEDQRERAIRVLRLHNDQARWKNTVASDYDLSAGGDRWRQSAEKQAALVTRGLDKLGWQESLPRAASVTAQLHELDLDRLYSGYRLASEYVHGGLSSAFETETIKAENSPFGIYWPNDWFLAVNMCAWGCLFLARNSLDRGFDIGPVRGSMLAAELMLISPGPGWRQNS